MTAFTFPFAGRLPARSPLLERAVCTRVPLQMSAGSEKFAKILRGAAAGAAAAAVALAAAGPVHASLGLQAVPVRLSESPPNISRLAVRWDRASYGCDVETLIVVANESRIPVDLLWVDYQGREVEYATIAPGRTHLQPSYATHPWVVREHASQNAILFVMARETPAVAVVGVDPEHAPAAADAALAALRAAAN